MGVDKVWFFYDQLLVKEPNTAEPTPWHQDGPYWPLRGEQVMSIWVPFDHATRETGVVTYVKGSHPFSNQHDHLGIHPQAQDGIHVACGHAGAVALEVDQHGSRDPNGELDIAVKGLWAGHETRLLVLEHLGHGEFGPLGVGAVLPALAAAHAQPGC